MKLTNGELISSGNVNVLLYQILIHYIKYFHTDYLFGISSSHNVQIKCSECSGFDLGSAGRVNLPMCAGVNSFFKNIIKYRTF